MKSEEYQYQISNEVQREYNPLKTALTLPNTLLVMLGLIGFGLLVPSIVRHPFRRSSSLFEASMYLSNPHLYKATGRISQIIAITADEAKESKVPSNLIEVVTHKVILDETLFHPQGGGQPSDRGTLVTDSGDVFKVVFASSSSKTGDKINEHFGYECIASTTEKVPDVGELTNSVATLDMKAGNESTAIPDCRREATLFEGQRVEMLIDIEHRQMSTRLHSAGHSIDAALKRCKGDVFGRLKATKGYHFTDGPYVEYEGDLTEQELKELPDIITKHMDEIVKENIMTVVRMMEKSEASTLLNLAAEELQYYPNNVRIVDVAGTFCAFE